MSRLEKAIAAAREALENEAPTAEIDAVRLDGAIRELIASLDEARGQAVAWCCPQTTCDADGYPEDSETPYMEWGQARPDWQGQWTPLYAAPPAAGRDESLIDIGGECVPRWIVEYANALTTYFAERGGRSWAIGGVQSREKAPPAALADAVHVFNCHRCNVSVESRWQPPECPECDDLCVLDASAKPAPPAAMAEPADNVTPMRQPRTDLARLVESINAAVYANGDGLSVTEAIGALELAKLELLKEQEQ